MGDPPVEVSQPPQLSPSRAATMDPGKEWLRWQEWAQQYGLPIMHDLAILPAECPTNQQQR